MALTPKGVSSPATDSLPGLMRRPGWGAPPPLATMSRAVAACYRAKPSNATGKASLDFGDRSKAQALSQNKGRKAKG